MTSTALTIGGRGVRRDIEGRYCLNDCHKASGLSASKAPAQWLRTDTAAELSAELRARSDVSTPSTQPPRLSPLYTPPYQVVVKSDLSRRMGKDSDGAHRIFNRIDGQKP